MGDALVSQVPEPGGIGTALWHSPHRMPLNQVGLDIPEKEPDSDTDEASP